MTAPPRPEVAPPPVEPLLLAIDCGTQSVRALLFDLEGSLVGRAGVPLDGYRSPEPGWVEHDAEAFWAATALACQTLWQTHGHLRPALRGVAVTTQRGTVMPLDAAGRALAPAITWMDQRRAARVPVIHALWRAAFRLAGVAGTVRYFQREAEANWWAEQRPGLWAKLHKLVLVSGLLHWKLTGRFVDSVGAQVGYLPFDFRRHRWCKAWDWKWQALPLRPDQLPELVPVGGRLGEITAAAAELTGIPAGLPVIAAAADKASEALGAGAMADDVGALSFGTTATVSVCLRRHVEPLPFVPPYPAAWPGHFACEVQVYRGFWMVRWFKEQFGDREQGEAARTGRSAESLLDELVAGVPAGALGLMLQPYWTPGLRHPGPDAKGAVIGFGDVHTRAHLYRAVLEGLAYALREGRERIERRSGARLTSLRACGGGARSDAALQITADVFGLPVLRPHTLETSGLGAAIACAVGLGLHADFPAAVRRMTRAAQHFLPQPRQVALYDALYRDVYQPMYARLAPLYARIQRITGYPEKV